MTYECNQYKIVNESGLIEIQKILQKHHKNFLNCTDEEFLTSYSKNLLHAWAEKVESQLSEGNPPCFEIVNWDSVTGQTQTFELSADSLETRYGNGCICGQCIKNKK